MSALFAAIFLLGLCLTNAINFTTVYEWETLDFSWPLRVDSSIIGKMKQNFYPRKVQFQNMAVFGERLFLSLDREYGIPATLVWLPTSDTSNAPPKLKPFPTWDFHKEDDCDTIQAAKGMEADTEGRLWVLDKGSSACPSKIWIFHLLNKDAIEHIHHFPDAVVSHSYYRRELRDIVLDKTPDDYFAYITDYYAEQIVVFSRNTDKSWEVKTPGKRWNSLALSANREARQLYLGSADSSEMYSVSVSELKIGSGSPTVKFIGTWTEFPYRMLIDSANVLYAAFKYQNYISKWNISESFRKQRFHEVGSLFTPWPFTFAFDTNNNIWMTERNETGSANRHKLLRAAVGVRSYLFNTPAASLTPQVNLKEETSTQMPTSSSGTTTQPALESNGTCGGLADLEENYHKSQSLITVLIWLLVCCLICLVLSGAVIAWLTLRMRRMQTSLRHISKENQELLPSSCETRP
ncbi:protein yellow-like [Cloeon dipterum]|uniref:protein yellow-like n=1 Tax=Cloeon dipterum TaxID=197152 RepID=UPI00321FAA4D